MYCKISDVEGKLQLKIAPSGRPNREQVEEEIVRQSSEIDGILQAQGYSLPISNTTALEYLNALCTVCTTAAVLHTGFFQQNASAKATYWKEQCENQKARLSDGKAQVPGLTPEGPEDPVFMIAPHPNRDRFWWTKDVVDTR